MIARLVRDLTAAVHLARSRRALVAPYADAVGLAALAAIHARGAKRRPPYHDPGGVDRTTRPRVVPDGAGVRARANARRFVRAGARAVAVVDVARVELRGERVILVERGGREHVLDGFDAVEAALQLAPSLLEGRRLRWARHAWAVHNLVAHPAMQLAAWLGAPRLGLAIHDATVPRPTGRTAAPPPAAR